ncbi:unnamed protein product [Closterium sp. NIES-54]
MFITLYFIVTRLPESLRSVNDHFLSLDPTSLTVDLLEQHLLAAETSAVAVGAAHGTPCPPFFEGCSPSPVAPVLLLKRSLLLRTLGLLLLVRSAVAARARVARVEEVAAVVVEVAAGVVVGAAVEVVAAVGLVEGVGALEAAVEAAVGVAAVAAVGLVAVGLALGVLVLEVASVSSSSVGARPSHPSSFACGNLHTHNRYFSRLDDAWRAEFGDDIKLPRWADLLRSRIAIFDLDFDAILSAMYALSLSAEGECYRCVPPDPGIAAAALGASESGTLPGTAPTHALHTFTLDLGALRCFFRDSTTLTPLPAPVPVRLADPSGGPDVARSSTILPSEAVPSGSLSGLHLPSFSTNLVSTAALQDAMVTTTTPGGQRVSICTCTRTGHHLATFTHRPGSSLYTLATEPPQVAASRFGQDLPVLRLHSNTGGEFSSNLLRDFCRGEGILQSFTFPDSPQQNGIAERRIGLVMEVARTSMIHAAAPHFLWSFVVRYAAHQLNLGHTALDGGGWRYVGFLGRHVRRGPAPSGVSQVDPLPGIAPVEEAVGSAGGAGSEGAGIGGAKPEGVEPGGAESEGAESGAAEPRGAASSGGPAGASPRLSPQQLREWLVRRARLWSGAPGAGGAGDAGGGGAGVTAVAGGTGGTTATGPGGACTRGAGATGTGGVGGAGAGHPTEPEAAGAGGSCAGTGTGGAGAAGPGAVDPGAGGAGGTMRQRPYFVPLLQQILGVPSSTSLTPPLLCPPPDQSQPPLQPASPLPAPSPCTEQPGSLTECRSPPAFKARYVARGFSQRQGVDYFHTFSPTPKMTTLWVLLHVAAQREYEFHSLDFSTAFLQGSLHKEIWLRRPPGFTGSFPAGTQWSLHRPVYGLRQAPRKWHDTLRTTLTALGFAPSTADPSLFLRTDTSLPPFYVLVYVDDLVFAIGDSEALTLVKSELQKRHTCTDLGELRTYLGLQITRDRARRTITLNQSHMVHQVLQHFGF